MLDGDCKVVGTLNEDSGKRWIGMNYGKLDFGSEIIVLFDIDVA